MTEALLLSGGLDSSSLAALRRPSHAIFVDYGQVAAAGEAEAAEAVCAYLQIDLTRIYVDCRAVGAGSMAGSNPPAGSPSEEWWPFRNQLIATLAAAASLEIGVDRLVFGTVATDSFHSDGTPRFFDLLNRLLRYQEGGLEVVAPATDLRSEDLVRNSGADRNLVRWTHSCHVSNFACGLCGGCNKRRAVLRSLGWWHEVDLE